MEDRYGKKVPVECSAPIAGESIIGEGPVIDVSLPGCLMEISELARPGDYLQ
jgi:hypothetical protein